MATRSAFVTRRNITLARVRELLVGLVGRLGLPTGQLNVEPLLGGPPDLTASEADARGLRALLEIVAVVVGRVEALEQLAGVRCPAPEPIPDLGRVLALECALAAVRHEDRPAFITRWNAESAALARPPDGGPKSAA